MGTPYIITAIAIAVAALGLSAFNLGRGSRRGGNADTQSAPAPVIAQQMCCGGGCGGCGRTRTRIVREPCGHEDLERRVAALERSNNALWAVVRRLQRRFTGFWQAYYAHNHSVPPHSHPHSHPENAADDHTHDDHHSVVGHRHGDERWNPGWIIPLIGAIVGAIVGVITLKWVTSRDFVIGLFPHGVERHLSASVNHFGWQCVWVFFFAVAGGAIALMVLIVVDLVRRGRSSN